MKVKRLKLCFNEFEIRSEGYKMRIWSFIELIKYFWNYIYIDIYSEKILHPDGEFIISLIYI